MIRMCAPIEQSRAFPNGYATGCNESRHLMCKVGFSPLTYAPQARISSTVQNCKYCQVNVVILQCIAQPNTTLLDCILYLMQYLYDPGILPSSANYCILGKVYLRCNLSRKCGQPFSNVK